MSFYAAGSAILADSSPRLNVELNVCQILKFSLYHSHPSVGSGIANEVDNKKKKKTKQKEYE